jgi:long-chain acyl-CoA synthetase
MTPGAADEDRRRDMTRAGMAVAYWAQARGERPALLSPSGRRSFSALNARANQVVRALRRRGLQAGDAVALMCGNRLEFVEVYVACLRAGWRLTPISFHLTGGEAAYIVADSEARAFVADAGLGRAAQEAAAETGGLGARLVVGGALPGFEAYDDAISAEDTTDIDDPTPGATMLYTSGTTGRPKGVYREQTVEPPVEVWGYREDSAHLCTGPLYHAAPLSMSLHIPLLCGVGVVIMPRWDAEEALRLIAAHRVTHTHMVPTMFHRLLALPESTRRGYDLYSLRAIVHGAAPCPVAVKQAMMAWLGPIVWEYYAATEGAGTVVDPQSWLARPGTVGKPNPADQVIVGDEEARPLPPREVGLVWLKAPAEGRFRYFKDDAKTGSAYRGDYFTLGDMGYLDENGFLFLTDRSANLIISGGVNIYPAEIDAVLLAHPSVADVAAIGVPSDEWGEEVKAVVEVAPGVTPSAPLAAELIAYCRDRLAHFKCPRSVDFVDRLPRLDNGKIYKRLLRDRYRPAR